MATKTDLPVCSICQRNYEGYGNNAAPVNTARCCDQCNALVVIPARINIFRRSRGKESVVSRRES